MIRLARAAALVMLTGFGAAQAQLPAALGGSSALDRLGGALPGGALGGLGMPALDSVGIGNLAGVLSYCARNNLLGAGGSKIKDRLLERMGGQKKASADPGYEQGLKGVLGGGGQQLDLAALKDRASERACDLVLEHGQSLL